MEDLQDMYVQQLASNLSSVTIKETLMLAYLHDIGNLKQASMCQICQDQLLGACSVLNDFTTDEHTADIWNELVRNCLPCSSAYKLLGYNNNEK